MLMRKITIYMWGYWGWGNAAPELVKAVDAVERKRGFLRHPLADVRMGTLYRIKGLEFKAVARGLTGEQVSSSADNQLKAKRYQCLRYVAATRARERLLICTDTK